MPDAASVNNSTGDDHVQDHPFRAGCLDALALPAFADDHAGHPQAIVDVAAGKGGAMVIGARITMTDIMAVNQVIHVIDAVLLPN